MAFNLKIAARLRFDMHSLEQLKGRSLPPSRVHPFATLLNEEPAQGGSPYLRKGVSCRP